MGKPLRIAVPIDLDWPLPHHLDVYRGIQDYAERTGTWELFNDQFPAQWIAPRGRRPGYDGVVGRVTPVVLAACRKANVPVVNCWADSPAAGQMPTVAADFHAAGRLAAEHLLARGFRHLASVGYRDRRSLGTRAYFAGVKAVADEHGVPWSGHLISYAFNSNDKAWRAFVRDADRWFERWSKPMGLTSAQDNHARQFALMAQRRGLAIPEEFAIVGAGNSEATCAGSEPSLSSVDLGYHRVGCRAAELLDGLLSGRPAMADLDKPVLCPPVELVARRSSDSYIVNDHSVGRAMRFMAERCGDLISVADVVAHVGCSRRTLERRFQETLGHTINDSLLALRLEIVKRLLVNTRAPVQAIARQAGFGTPEHMRYVFKQREGLSPGQFRRRHQAKP